MVVGLIGHHGLFAVKHVAEVKNFAKDSVILRNQWMVDMFVMELHLKWNHAK